jgi:hypothetical protein
MSMKERTIAEFERSAIQAPTAAYDEGETGQADEYLIWGMAALAARRDAVRMHQARFAQIRQRWIKNNTYFYSNIERVLRFIVEPGRRLLHLRCQTGFFLDTLNPSRGVGVEITREMAEIARQQYPHLEFATADPEELILK